MDRTPTWRIRRIGHGPDRINSREHIHQVTQENEDKQGSNQRKELPAFYFARNAFNQILQAFHRPFHKVLKASRHQLLMPLVPYETEDKHKQPQNNKPGAEKGIRHREVNPRNGENGVWWDIWI